jgi:hypothetical protein
MERRDKQKKAARRWLKRMATSLDSFEGLLPRRLTNAPKKSIVAQLC